MDDSARPGPSSESGASRPRPRAVVQPNILEGDQIIKPLTGENPNIQVAVLNMNEGGQYHLIRTGPLVINPKEHARDPSSPVPVALPNGTSILGIATVLPIELMHIMLPNVAERHHDMLLELEREEERICELRWTPPVTDIPLPAITDPVETCRLFLANILAMSSTRPPRLAKAVHLLVQLMIDDVIDSEQFCGRLERLLDAQPQPNAVLFLKKNIRALRQALYFNRVTLAGIDRPELRVAFSIPIPEPELPEYLNPPASEPASLVPIAAVAPLQPIPLSDIPYDLPLPLAPVQFRCVRTDLSPAGVAGPEAWLTVADSILAQRGARESLQPTRGVRTLPDDAHRHLLRDRQHHCPSAAEEAETSASLQLRLQLLSSDTIGCYRYFVHVLPCTSYRILLIMNVVNHFLYCRDVALFNLNSAVTFIIWNLRYNSRTFLKRREY